MLKCVIFDMDGTIADTVPLCVAAVHRAVEPLLGHSISDEEILATFGPSEEGTIHALLSDRYEEGLVSFFEQYRQLHCMCSTPFDGIVELLHSLKDQAHILALVTGKGPHSLEISMDVLGLNNIFDAIETGVPHGPSKPVGLQNVMRKLDLSPKDCVYIGDAPSDIVACRAVGMSIISAAWDTAVDVEKIQNLKPDHICFTVEELKRYLALLRVDL
ncbi:MAG: HAD family hydrolase [Thermoguttaceae bacterium]